MSEVSAAVRHQNGRPAQVPGAQDLHNTGDDEAQKDRDTAHAWDGLSVDTALGGIVDGVELDCQALDQGHREEGRDKSRGRHA